MRRGVAGADHEARGSERPPELAQRGGYDPEGRAGGEHAPIDAIAHAVEQRRSGSAELAADEDGLWVQDGRDQARERMDAFLGRSAPGAAGGLA